MATLMAAAAAATGHQLFSYNRQNFMFDKDQKQEREYQSQKLRIKQFGLYREDIRDMMELTCSKMDIYLIVNTLLLMFCIILFTEGRPFREKDTGVSPTWLLYMYGITNVSAFTFFLLSIWLSIHASVAAHSFGVRMLTQFVRLPVPNKRQLDAGKATASEYEGAGAGTLFRIPLWRQQLARMNNMLNNDDSTKNPRRSDSSASGLGDDGGVGVGAAAEALTHGGQAKSGTLKHVKLFRQLQANWQAYDAYARVSMTLGINQLILATAYYIMQILIVEQMAVEAAFGVVVALGYAAWLMIRLDLYTDRRMLRLGAVLLMMPLLLTYLAVAVDQCKVNEDFSKITIKIVVPIAIICNLLWILVLVQLARPDEFDKISLPVRFRSVLYLDVFGWLDKEGGQARRAGIQKRDTEVLAGHARAANQAGGGEDHMPTLQEGEESPGNRRSRNESAPPSMGHAVSLRGSQTGSMLPPALQTGLGAHCWKQQALIQNDLVRWESEGVAKLLKEDPDGHLVVGAIRDLRQQFQTLLTRLQNADPNGNDNLTPRPERSGKVWLHLQWENGGEPWSYYHCVEDRKVVIQKPDGRVMELVELMDELDNFTRRIEAVEGAGGAALTRALSQQMLQEPSAERHRMDTDKGSFQSHGSARSVDERDTDAQETRFGGRDAVHGGAGLEVTNTGGEGFHPHRVSRADVVKRPPGQIPWRTFFNGSMIIVFTWVMGVVWVAIEVVAEVEIPFFTIEDRDDPWPEGESPELFAVAADWPHRFFTPSGLACHPDLGDSMLVSEKYAVHELRLVDGGSRAEVRPALQECLAQAPGFLSGGLRGVSVECAEGVCHAVLASAKGLGALRCPLGAEGQGVKLETRGPRWRTLAAGDGEGAAWALGEHALVRLEPREGAAHELVPEMEVPHASRSHEAIESLHVIGNRAILGLDPAGRLHSWPLRQSQGPPQTYPLPTGGPAWSGVCATSEALYLASAPSSKGPAGVWRTTLRPELRA